MGRIVVGYSKKGKPITTDDLEVAGAMTAWMVEAINPNLLQSIEGQPVFVQPALRQLRHRQSSIIADGCPEAGRLPRHESGFGADIASRSSGTSSAATAASSPIARWW